jgi:hypothetical protein
VEVIEFRPPDHEAIVAAMHDLATARRGWITLQPGVRQEDAPPARSALGGLFTGTGPPVPVGTWVAPEPSQKPPHAELGLLHQGGPKVVRKLSEAGLEVPGHWVVLADHPKRGLVIAVHPESPHVEVLDWLLRAATLLTRVPLTGAWQASIHGRP